MIDYTVHIGPYLRCTYTLEEVTRTMYTCPNRDCERHGEWLPQRDAYCRLCGSPAGDYASKSMFPPEDVQYMAETIQESMRTIDELDIGTPDALGVDVWVPNVPRDQPRPMTFDPFYNTGIYPLGDEQTEKTWLRDAFAEEIKLFLDAYDNVTLEWGIIIEAS